MNTPEISVLMSAYNAGKFIGESIESILAQTFKNFEFIIIDDGSTDDTKNIVNSYQDDRIKFFKNNTNLGLSESLNKGIRHARGKYIARMDADDISSSDRFYVQYAYMQQNPQVDIAGSYTTILNSRHKLTPPINDIDIKSEMLFNNALSHPSVIAKANILKNHKYSKYFVVAQDYELWCRLIDIATYGNINKFLVIRREHDENLTKKRSLLVKEVTEIQKLLLKKHNIKIADSMYPSYKRLFSNNTSIMVEDIKNIYTIALHLLQESKNNRFCNRMYLSKRVMYQILIKTYLSDFTLTQKLKSAAQLLKIFKLII